MDLKKIYLFVVSFQEPIWWIINRNVESILDIGCGDGFPMEVIKIWRHPKKTVGVDLFMPYIKIAKKKKSHDKFIVKDVRKISFPDKSFDTVICMQVLEHLTKKEAFDLLLKMEKIAKRQVIVATPIGHMHHPHVDNNVLQEHKSSFMPSDFEKKGFKTIKFGRKSILGENGIIHKTKNLWLKRLIFAINILLSPIFYFFQFTSDYHVYAYKNLTEK